MLADNDEIRMTKLEGMTNDRAYRSSVIRALGLFRDSAFLLRHSGIARSER
jgi:hypothetical protein